MRDYRGIGIAAYALVLSGCGSDVLAHPIAAVEAQAPVEVAVASPRAGNPRADRSWFGQSRNDLETRMAIQPGNPEAGGWVPYGHGLRVRYELNIVTGIATPVPEGLGCEEAAKWMGFPSANRPVSRDGICEWSGGFAHRLGHGHTGRMDPATRIFQVELGS